MNPIEPPSIVPLAITSEIPLDSSAGTSLNREKQKHLDRANQLPQKVREEYKNKIEGLFKHGSEVLTVMPRLFSGASALSSSASSSIDKINSAAQELFENFKNYSSDKGSIIQQLNAHSQGISSFKISSQSYKAPAPSATAPRLFDGHGGAKCSIADIALADLVEDAATNYENPGQVAIGNLWRSGLLTKYLPIVFPEVNSACTSENIKLTPPPSGN